MKLFGVAYISGVIIMAITRPDQNAGVFVSGAAMAIVLLIIHAVMSMVDDERIHKRR